MKPDWFGFAMAPSQIASIVRDTPRLRAYDTRKGLNLAKSFEHYLEAAVPPRKSWEEVRDFLTGCLYAKDEAEHAGRRDVWLHPEDFERRLRGDCEDHALWAWVQLARLNWDVRFTVGILDGGGHAWVTVYRRTSIALIETTEKSPDKILRPSAPDTPYEPVWSVDTRLRFYLHGKA